MDTDFSFKTLTPDSILNGIDSLGLETDGRLFEMNSFENRVFQVGILDSAPVIAKFYRPGRWTDPQIQEEHDFTLTLLEREIPAIAPLLFDGKTLFHWEGFSFCVYAKVGGHAPELDIADHLTSIGRTLGRIHATGSSASYQFRPDYPYQAMGRESAEYLLQQHIPQEHLSGYQSAINPILELLDTQQSAMQTLPYLRLHGDCHLGNILWQSPTPFFLDFDDSCNGPQIADIWMLFAQSDDKQVNQQRLNIFLEGYEMFFDFDDDQLKFTENFRTMRMVNYASWVGTRWEDPAFKKAFSWFGTDGFWREHIHDLKLQFERMR